MSTSARTPTEALRTGTAETLPPGQLAAAPWSTEADAVRITGIRTFLTAPAHAPLLVVRVETNQPGLYGLGCASSPQRPQAIRTVIDEYLAPMLTGRSALDSEDIHQLVQMSGYWRGGAIANNALAGVDIALWDLKGKVAGLPVYQLLGGRVRDRVTVYGHADGLTFDEVVAQAHEFVARGYRHVRCQVAVPGADTYGIHGWQDERTLSDLAARRAPWLSGPYARIVPELFTHVRAALGDGVELLHDVHERLTPPQSIRLARDLEPFRLFFLEDSLPPEELDWYRQLRVATTTPIAVGEVFSDLRTFVPLVREHLIDFARIRMGAIGGLTPTWKLAHYCELEGVRLAIHGPGDVSPIGHAAAIAVDAASSAFGIQESHEFPDPVHEVFPGTPVVVGGAYPISTDSGLGVDFDERAAAAHPAAPPLEYDAWALLRHGDGQVARP